MTINCELCKEVISKHKLDFYSCGGLSVELKIGFVNICQDCAKKIAIEVINDN